MGREKQSIIALPLYERRYIAVVSDEDFERKLSNDGQGGFGSSIWPILGTVGSSLVAGPALLMTAGAQRFLSSRFDIKEKSRAVEPQPGPDDGKIKSSAVRLVRMRDADELRITSGSVEVGDVYAAHPLVKEIYYPLESYNDDLLDHKLSELERIINSLGAKRYSITFEQQEDVMSKIAASASWLRGGQASGELQRSRKRRFERSGTADGRDPALCDGLIWYDREPAWQSLVESRLHYGRRGFKLMIELEQSLKVTAQVAAEVKKIASLDIGGKHQRDFNLTLSVDGTF